MMAPFIYQLTPLPLVLSETLFSFLVTVWLISIVETGFDCRRLQIGSTLIGLLLLSVNINCYEPVFEPSLRRVDFLFHSRTI